MTAKDVIGRSVIHDMEVALGQYIMYDNFLDVIEPDRKLYLAISDDAYEIVFQRQSIQFLVERNDMSLLVVAISAEEILQWIQQ